VIVNDRLLGIRDCGELDDFPLARRWSRIQVVFFMTFHALAFIRQISEEF
jgi:hypothetical protein